MKHVITTDLGDFGDRELTTLSDILIKIRDEGEPDFFDFSGITINFNRDSGMVFLCNSNYEVIALNGENLELWHYLPYSGLEGFKSNLLEEFGGDMQAFKNSLECEDVEYLQERGFFN